MKRALGAVAAVALAAAGANAARDALTVERVIRVGLPDGGVLDVAYETSGKDDPIAKGVEAAAKARNGARQ